MNLFIYRLAKRLQVLFACVLFLYPALLFSAPEPLNRATFTDVVNDVAVVKPATNVRIPARKDDQVKAPDLVRTGERSRAELRAPDSTLTRIGANTILSFKQDGRGINLEQGSVLFHSPTGKGGGTIQTAAVTAAVTGTTIIVVCTKDGGFKLLVMEGRGTATLPNGKSVNVGPGQLVFVLPGSKGFSPVFNYHLMQQSQNAKLVDGFTGRLDSLPKIEKAIDLQNDLILKGDLVVTNLLVTDGSADANGVPVLYNSTVQSIFADVNFLAALIQAFQNDVTLTNSIFPVDQIFGALYFPGGKDYLGVRSKDFYGSGTPPQDAQALVGRNIDLQMTSLNMSAYAGLSQFVFAANGNMTLSSPMSITGPGPSRVTFFAKDTLSVGSITYSGGGLDLTAGTVNIANNSNIQASSATEELSVYSYSDLSLNNVNLKNTTGPASLGTDGILTTNGGSVVGGSSATMYAGTDMSATNTNVQGISDAMMRAEGSLTTSGGNLQGATVTMSAGMDMNVTGTNFNSSNPNLIAGRNMTVNGATFSGSPGTIRMEATRLILIGINFPAANVNLFTGSGNWSSTVPLPDNAFLSGCTYNGGPTISGSGGPGSVIATSGPNTMTSYKIP